MKTFYQAIQISTLPLFTDQQIFDFVAQEMLNQGYRSTDDHGACRYRGNSDRKCAFGFLIADSEMSSLFEGERMRRVLQQHFPETFHLLKHAAGIDTVNLLRCLQSIHDGTMVCDWKEILRGVADQFDLDDQILN